MLPPITETRAKSISHSIAQTLLAQAESVVAIAVSEGAFSTEVAVAEDDFCTSQDHFMAQWLVRELRDKNPGYEIHLAGGDNYSTVVVIEWVKPYEPLSTKTCSTS